MRHQLCPYLLRKLKKMYNISIKNRLHHLLTKEAQRSILFSVVTFTLNYFISHTLFSMLIAPVSYSKFLYFWLAVDGVAGISVLTTERISEYKNNTSDDFVNISYTLCYAAVLLVLWIIKLVVGL